MPVLVSSITRLCISSYDSASDWLYDSFNRDWMCRASTNGLGLKNSFRIGLSSRRTNRSSGRLDANRVVSSNA